MRTVEWGLAAVFVVLGIRSLLHWLAAPLDSETVRDRVLYALFVMSRAGLWFALAGLFVLYGAIGARGRAFVDASGDLRWYFFVLALPAVGQFLTGFLLGRGSAQPRPDRDPDAPRG